MARADFIAGLKAMGFEVEQLDGARIAFPFEVPCGSLSGSTVKIGLEVHDDWPLNPPAGPHITPFLRPIQPGGVHPTGGIHASPFGTEWQYWSRPYQGWKPGANSVRQYLAHLHNLFEKQ